MSEFGWDPPSGPPVWPAPMHPSEVAYPPSAGPSVAPTGPARPRRWPLAALAAVVLVVAAVFGTLLATGSLTRKEFDQAALGRGVTQVLTKKYGIGAVTSAQCPAHIQVTRGLKFVCTVQIGPSTEQVTVTVLNGAGQYQVGAPR